MSKEENNINVLDDLNKGTTMGMDAITFILDKVEDKKLKDVLNIQYNEYKEINEEIVNIYSKYSDKEPHETNAVNKAMTWYGIEIKTFMDKSNSKIAELLLQGTNMGIIEGRKLLNHKDADKKVNDLVQKYVDMQEKAVEELKKFL